MLFQIKKLLFSDKEIAFKQSNFSWQKLGRGRLEVAGRWKDEVKACPAHKSGGKKNDSQIRWEKGRKTSQVWKRRKSESVGKKNRKKKREKNCRREITTYIWSQPVVV